MPVDVVTDLHMDPSVRGQIEGYLADLSARLVGPAPTRAAILDELNDGLLEAAMIYLARGLAPAAAAAAAIEEFGDPRLVAAAFGAELAAAQARRVGLGYLLTGPLVGALWVTAMASPVPPWRHAATGMWAAAPLLGLALAVGGLSALLAVASTERLSPWLPVPPGTAATAAVVTGLSAAVGDVVAFAMLIVRASSASNPVPWAVLAAAMLANLARLGLGGRAVRRCLAVRAAIG